MPNILVRFKRFLVKIHLLIEILLLFRWPQLCGMCLCVAST